LAGSTEEHEKRNLIPPVIIILTTLSIPNIYLISRI